MKIKTLLIVTASVLTVAVPTAGDAAKPILGTWGYDQSAMNSSVKPGDDFWGYVNGSWDQRTQIPADHPSVGSFITLRDGSERDVRQIAEALAKNPNGNQVGRQIGDYYSTFMDEGAIEAAGTAPLKPYLARIDAVQSLAQLQPLFVTPGYARPIGIGMCIIATRRAGPLATRPLRPPVTVAALRPVAAVARRGRGHATSFQA